MEDDGDVKDEEEERMMGEEEDVADEEEGVNADDNEDVNPDDKEDVNPDEEEEEGTAGDKDEEAMEVMDDFGVGMPVDSGGFRSASACAADVLNMSPSTTSRYAHAGIAVPDGMSSGHTPV